MTKKILILDDDQFMREFLHTILSEDYELRSANRAKEGLNIAKEWKPDLIVSDLYMPDMTGLEVLETLQNEQGIPDTSILILSGSDKSTDRISCFVKGASDFLAKPFHPEELKLRIARILKTPFKKLMYTPQVKVPRAIQAKQKTPWLKRLFDIAFSSACLVALSPVFLVIATSIAVESKGKIFYASKRVGRDYKVFDFYKFRSMYQDADSRLAKMGHLNQYQKNVTIQPEGTTHKICPICEGEMGKQVCGSRIIADNERSECEFITLRKKEKQSSFLKFENDPRITKVGRFIRSTSIDELPQLFNVLKGDMSIVGNRPLPLYEAEKLTHDQAILRFQAPSGITGLWQVTKRGKSDMSEEERLSLDNEYAQKWSILKDIKILFRTIPALLQSENV